MTWYELWLFLHIAATAVWVGGGFVAQVLGVLAKRSGDPVRSAALGQDLAFVGPWVFMPSALLVLLSGILLTEDGNWDWGETFIVLGLLGWALVSFAAFGYLTRAMGRVAARMRSEGPSAELGAQLARLVLLARILIGVLFLLVFLMVVKPGT